ncbi:helix-turn-helix domain-containing protein [Amycolatopsis rhabdoformis]|uniref:Helix-turn-helix domain-containing protein n=1 Tax=Amycolatopsis rhabdoformis TaxID=1448059 RepID=A0ABZ1IIU3_9PSEU|nr:helix-turn-helix domain-containing protein [Amycolatopsis rhabdoformis]WSE33716.1 helix-turn-helix domain-containing protein [Amycolatopsis rhabdoformis]
MTDHRPGLRERTRRAVRQDITEAAQRLFVEHGYEQTTMDDVAEAAGLSRRSLFRYFPTKEDLIVGKFELLAETMVELLRERPLAEPAWTSLRRIFDLLVPYVDAPGKHEVAEPMQRIVFSTPALLASYLEKLHRMAAGVETVLRERAETRGAPYEPGDPAPPAIAGAAFSCLLAAQHAWLAGGAGEDGATFAGCLDRAMAALAPAGTA